METSVQEMSMTDGGPAEERGWTSSFVRLCALKFLKLSAKPLCPFFKKVANEMNPVFSH